MLDIHLRARPNVLIEVIDVSGRLAGRDGYSHVRRKCNTLTGVRHVRRQIQVLVQATDVADIAPDSFPSAATDSHVDAVQKKFVDSARTSCEIATKALVDKVKNFFETHVAVLDHTAGSVHRWIQKSFL